MHKKEHGRGREENGNDCDCDCDCQPWARAAQTLRRHEANTFGRALSLSLSLSLWRRRHRNILRALAKYHILEIYNFI